MPKTTDKTFSKRAREWARKNGLHDSQAYLRYVFFVFLDCLAKGEDEFIFKGGNLLWLYIQTPRQTIDLDLVTKSANTEDKVKRLLENACGRADGIIFEIGTFKEVRDGNMLGASVTIRFHTEDGAKNTFDMDIVYALPTASRQIASPIHDGEELCAATLENIIADKVSACHRFGGGNTRMKDYDDLFRMSQMHLEIDWAIVKKLLGKKVSSLDLDTKWINLETSASWKRHVERYTELPEDLETVVAQINRWLLNPAARKTWEK